ncbi:high-affinity lysophosphatidic acid receptor-like [Bolinopsis microptera]|uniref:high-affinity lysophosphatidic acid receptor-like n=1 Tax=Bolinopsis microptera TaxID=2820187 RepID=UPI003079E30E
MAGLGFYLVCFLFFCKNLISAVGAMDEEDIGVGNHIHDEDHSEDWWVGTDPLLGSITLLLTITAILGNITAIYYISTSAALRTPSFLVLLLLAIVDLTTGVLHLPFVTVACFTGNWIGEPGLLPDRNISLTRCKCTFMVSAEGWWCMVSSYVRPFSQPLSFVTVVIISALRVLSMYFPIAYRRVATAKRIMGGTLVIWVVTLLLTIPTAYYVKGYNYNLVAKQCMWNFTEWAHVRFGFVYNIVAFFILVAILVTLITLMVVGLTKRDNVQKGRRKLGNSKTSKDQKSQKSSSSTDYKHASLISIFVGLIWMVSIFPFYVFGIVRSYTNAVHRLDKSTEMALRTLTFWMLYLSPVVNPLLYVLRLPKVRNELQRRASCSFKRTSRRLKQQTSNLEEIIKTQSQAFESRLIQQASDLETRLKGAGNRSNSQTISLDAVICESFIDFGDCAMAAVMPRGNTEQSDVQSFSDNEDTGVPCKPNPSPASVELVEGRRNEEQGIGNHNQS